MGDSKEGKKGRKTDLVRSQSVDHVFPSSRVCWWRGDGRRRGDGRTIRRGGEGAKSFVGEVHDRDDVGDCKRSEWRADRLNRHLVRRCVGMLKWSLELRMGGVWVMKSEEQSMEDVGTSKLILRMIYISLLKSYQWIGSNTISAQTLMCSSVSPLYHKMLIANYSFSTSQLSDIEIVSRAYMLKEGSRFFPRLGVWCDGWCDDQLEARGNDSPWDNGCP